MNSNKKDPLRSTTFDKRETFRNVRHMFPEIPKEKLKQPRKVDLSKLTKKMNEIFLESGHDAKTFAEPDFSDDPQKEIHSRAS